TPQEYKGLLLDVYAEEKKLKAEGSKTFYNKKDHLWVPLLNELGELSYEPTDDGKIYGGCSIGCNSFCILADGTAFACRRFYSPIGKVPDQSIEEIFVSDELERYRLAEYEKCSACDLFQYCRGCPAVAYGETGRFTSPDPQCWK
ncbi:MAG: SPASM domain-containing protein, partial [Candidatus Aenigmatarchaeota archaeon]